MVLDVRYTRRSYAGFTRPLIEGEAVLDAGMLVIFGRLDGYDETHKVKS